LVLLKPGNRVKVEVFVKDPPLVFNTSVHLCDDKTIQIAAPSYSGKKIGVAENTRVLVTEVSPEGLLVVDTCVERMTSKHHVLWILPVPGIEGIHRIQNRREPRYEVDLHLPWREVDSRDSGSFSLCHVVNINSLGALLSLDREFDVGEEFLVDLTNLVRVGGEIPEKKVMARSKVARIAGQSGSVVGVTFENLGRKERKGLLDAIRRLKSEVR